MIIENVPQILKFSINIDGKSVKILDYVLQELEPLGYYVNYSVADAADYGTPQTRKRAIFLISNIKKWEFPKKMEKITVRDVIGELPSLESGEKSDIPLHYAKKHAERHVLWMKHTPTGETAFNNEKYYPQKEDGTRIKGFHNTFKRMVWDQPCPARTTFSGSMSSHNNVHPGHKLPDGTYSDARVLTLLETFIVSSIPETIDFPKDSTDTFIRTVIGEAIPPRLMMEVVNQIGR